VTQNEDKEVYVENGKENKNTIGAMKKALLNCLPSKRQADSNQEKVHVEPHVRQVLRAEPDYAQQYFLQ
jgi:hypothetical protein